VWAGIERSSGRRPDRRLLHHRQRRPAVPGAGRRVERDRRGHAQLHRRHAPAARWVHRAYRGGEGTYLVRWPDGCRTR